MPSSQPPAAARPSQPPPSNNISDENLKKLYFTYVRAKQQCGEPTAGITYDSMAAKIRAQIPSLLTKHGARAVEFKVVIKEGRAVLKAVPKV